MLCARPHVVRSARACTLRFTPRFYSEGESATSGRASPRSWDDIVIENVPNQSSTSSDTYVPDLSALDASSIESTSTLTARMRQRRAAQLQTASSQIHPLRRPGPAPRTIDAPARQWNAQEAETQNKETQVTKTPADSSEAQSSSADSNVQGPSILIRRPNFIVRNRYPVVDFKQLSSQSIPSSASPPRRKVAPAYSGDHDPVSVAEYERLSSQSTPSPARPPRHRMAPAYSGGHDTAPLAAFEQSSSEPIALPASPPRRTVAPAYSGDHDIAPVAAFEQSSSEPIPPPNSPPRRAVAPAYSEDHGTTQPPHPSHFSRPQRSRDSTVSGAPQRKRQPRADRQLESNSDESAVTTSAAEPWPPSVSQQRAIERREAEIQRNGGIVTYEEKSGILHAELWWGGAINEPAARHSDIFSSNTIVIPHANPKDIEQTTPKVARPAMKMRDFLAIAGGDYSRYIPAAVTAQLNQDPVLSPVAYAGLVVARRPDYTPASKLQTLRLVNKATDMS